MNKTPLTERDFQSILINCEKATSIYPKNQEAWHYYSLMNYEMCIFYSKKFSEEHNHEDKSHSSASSNSPNQNRPE